MARKRGNRPDYSNRLRASDVGLELLARAGEVPTEKRPDSNAQIVVHIVAFKQVHTNEGSQTRTLDAETPAE